jgi:hypothetical protein
MREQIKEYDIDFDVFLRFSSFVEQCNENPKEDPKEKLRQLREKKLKRILK